MEFDQSYNGNAPVDWNFPSPNATPTHGTFGNNVYHTPKTATYPTHFQDAFTTPQMPSYATPQQPAFWSTPVQRPQTSSETLKSNYFVNAQVGGSQNVGQAMYPSEHGYATTSPTYGNINSASMQMSMNTSFDSSQMQTPPPTRGTSVKKPQETPLIAFGTPSTIASRRYMTPQQAHVPSSNGAYTQQTPAQYPHIHFSPDMYQFANTGPASAPVMPQHRVLWDQFGSPLQPVPQTMLEDPFAPNFTGSMHGAFANSPQMDTQSMGFEPSAGLTNGMHQSRSMSAMPTNTGLPTTTSEAAAVTSIDPSQIYTSPVRPARRSDSQPEATLPPPQIRQGQRAEESSQRHVRTETMSSSSSSVVRPPSHILRSNTSIAPRPKSVHLPMSAKDSLMRSNSLSQVPRTSSPVKRFGRPPLGSISESRPRQPSVILTVDEFGTARAEKTQPDDSPTRVLKDRYPSLFDSDSSDAESDASDQTPSRPPSFIFDKRDERKAKAARLDPPVENLEGLNIPRSSSSTSMRKGIPPSRAVVAATAQLRRQSSFRRSTPSRNGQTRRSLTSSSTTSLIDTCPMDPAQQTPSGVEQFLLDQEGETSFGSSSETLPRPPSNAKTALDVHNRRWSMMSFEQQQAPAVSPQGQNFQATFSPNALSHTPRHPPHTKQILIRCACGVPNDKGQPLVQCQSCTQWVHGPCVGLDAHSRLAACFLCTKPPPRSSRQMVSPR